MRPASLELFIHYSGIRQTQLITVPGLIALPVPGLLGLPEHCLTIKGTTLPKRFKSTANEMHFHCHCPVPLALPEWRLERCTSLGSSSSPPCQQLITRAEWERCLCFRFRWRRWWTACFFVSLFFYSGQEFFSLCICIYIHPQQFAEMAKIRQASFVWIVVNSLLIYSFQICVFKLLVDWWR